MKFKSSFGRWTFKTLLSWKRNWFQFALAYNGQNILIHNDNDDYEKVLELIKQLEVF